MNNRFADLGFGIPKGSSSNEAIIKSFVAGEKINQKDVVHFSNDNKVFKTINDNEIFNYETVFNNTATSDISITKLNEQKYLLAYQKCIDSGYGALKVANVDGNNITFGNELIFNAGKTVKIKVESLTEAKAVLVCNCNDTTSKALLLSITNDTIIINQTKDLNSDALNIINVIKITDEKCVISFNNKSNLGVSQIISVSGNEMTLGNEFVFNNTITTDFSTDKIIDENKFIIAFQDQGNAKKGTCVIGTIYDSNITFSTEYVFCNYESSSIAVKSLTVNKIALCYQRKYSSNSFRGMSLIGTLNNNAITFTSEKYFISGEVSNIRIVKYSDDNLLILYKQLEDYYLNLALVINNIIQFNSSITVSNNSDCLIAHMNDNFIIKIAILKGKKHGCIVKGNICGSCLIEGDDYYLPDGLYNIRLKKIDENKVLITCSNLAFIANILGNSISYSSRVEICSDLYHFRSNFIISESKCIIFYERRNKRVYARAGYIRSSISFYSQVEITSKSVSESKVFEIGDSKYIVAYKIYEGGDKKDCYYIKIVEVNGSTISCGNEILISDKAKDIFVARCNDEKVIIMCSKEYGEKYCIYSKIGIVNNLDLTFSGSHSFYSKNYSCPNNYISMSNEKYVLCYGISYFRVVSLKNNLIKVSDRIYLDLKCEPKKIAKTNDYFISIIDTANKKFLAGFKVMDENIKIFNKVQISKDNFYSKLLSLDDDTKATICLSDNCDILPLKVKGTNIYGGKKSSINCDDSNLSAIDLGNKKVFILNYNKKYKCKIVQYDYNSISFYKKNIKYDGYSENNILHKLSKNKILYSYEDYNGDTKLIIGRLIGENIESTFDCNLPFGKIYSLEINEITKNIFLLTYINNNNIAYASIVQLKDDTHEIVFITSNEITDNNASNLSMLKMNNTRYLYSYYDSCIKKIQLCYFDLIENGIINNKKLKTDILSSKLSLLKLTHNKFIIAYINQGKGCLAIGTADSGLIILNKEYTFSDNEPQHVKVYAINNKEILVAFSTSEYSSIFKSTIDNDNILLGVKHPLSESIADNFEFEKINDTTVAVAYNDNINGNLRLISVNKPELILSNEYIFNDSKTINISLLNIKEQDLIISAQSIVDEIDTTAILISAKINGNVLSNFNIGIAKNNAEIGENVKVLMGGVSDGFTNKSYGEVIKGVDYSPVGYALNEDTIYVKPFWERQ